MAYYALPNYSGSAAPRRSGDYDAAPDPHGIAPKVFGGIPGTVDVPNLYGQMTDILPLLPDLNAQLGMNTLARAQGRLSPEQIRNIQDYSARFGISSGMPMSELATNLGARTIGTETAMLQQQGLQDYASLIPTIYKTQIVDPELQIDVAKFNAENKAKEDPGIGGIVSLIGSVAGLAGI